jgi:hypothetical protein
MKRQKPKAFDLPSPSASEADHRALAEAEAAEAPPLELGPAEPLGDLVDAGDGDLETPQTAIDLPRLSPPDAGPGAAARPIAVLAPAAAPYYMTAFLVSCLVLLAPLMFAWSYQRDLMPFRNDVFALGMVVMLAIGPAALVWLTAFVLHQMARMAAETRRAQAITDQLTQPTDLAARGAGSAVEQMRREIEHATAAAAAARTELLSLREVLASESERLVEAAEVSSRAATNLTRDLSAEREKMNILAGTLDAQAAGVTEAVTRQARMVGEAADLADAQLREAEAVLTARAADLAAAAGEASDAARVASEDLSRQVARLETASQSVGDQARAVEEGLTEQRTALVTAVDGLRADHEAFAAVAETQLARLSEVVVHAHEGASEVSQTAANSAEALGAMLGSARDQLANIVDAAIREREALIERSAEVLGALLANTGDQLANIVDAAGHERDLLSASAAQSVGAISEIAARERQAMEEQAQVTVDNILAAADRARREIEAQAQAIADERALLGASATDSMKAIAEAAARERDQLEAQARETINSVIDAADIARKAMEKQAETARDKVDQLSEAAFSAGQRAEKVFENRLNEARSLIEQSAGLVDEAGAASAARLGEGVLTARATLGELVGLLTDVDARIARLPDDALARADAVRASIERGMEELMASARRAAEETQSIDAAFQERVRRNYDMLSEAVRLMGVVAGAAGGAPRAASSLAAPPTARPPAAPTEPRAESRGFEPREPRLTDPRTAEPRPAADAGLRPRLRLTPTASDEEFKQVFDAAGGREAPRREASARDHAARDQGAKEQGEPGGEGWTWKELLSSMDEEPVIDETHLAELVLGEIETMGIDAGALLPRARIEEVADAAQAGDAEAVRAGVRRLAPAAIRRLSRRLASDRLFRAQSERFVQRYQALIGDTVRRGGDGMVIAALLGSDQGRAFLLFDTAFSDAT